jgi:hypothetical protein
MFNVLNNFLIQSGGLTSDIIETISKYEYDIMEKTLNRIFTQVSCEFIDPSHSDYICSLIEPNSNPELYVNYKEKYNPKLWNGVIQCIYGDNLALKMFSIDSMTDYLQLNSTNRHLFIPILLSSAFGENETRSNLTCLIFDYILSEVYFFDPNGWTTFFDTNSSFGINNIIVIEKIFSKYFNDLNIYSGIKFKYVSVFDWNRYNLNLYPTHIDSYESGKKNEILNGIITTIFCHHCHLNKKTIKECLNDFVELNEQDKLKLYNDYTSGFLNELKKTENENINLNNINIKLNSNKNEQNIILESYENYKNNDDEENYISVKPKNNKISLIFDDF